MIEALHEVQPVGNCVATHIPGHHRVDWSIWLASATVRVATFTPPPAGWHNQKPLHSLPALPRPHPLPLRVVSPMPGNTPLRHAQPRARAHRGPEATSWRGCSAGSQLLVAHDSTRGRPPHPERPARRGTFAAFSVGRAYACRVRRTPSFDCAAWPSKQLHH